MGSCITMKKEWKLNGPAPEGTEACECAICKGQFAVPKEVKADTGNDVTFVCEDCSASMDNIVQNAVDSATDILAKVGDLSSPADKAAQI